MEIQELNERQRLARLDSYFSALKEVIQPESKETAEEEENETA